MLEVRQFLIGRGADDYFQQGLAVARVDHPADDLARGRLAPDEASVLTRAQGETLGGEVDEQTAIFLPPAQGLALGKTRPDQPDAPAWTDPHRNTLTGHDDHPVDPQTRTHRGTVWMGTDGIVTPAST